MLFTSEFKCSTCNSSCNKILANETFSHSHDFSSRGKLVEGNPLKLEDSMINQEKADIYTLNNNQNCFEFNIDSNE